jgi:serine/threonine protein kinase
MEEWIISRNEIYKHPDSKKNILGKGQFGVVTKGYWRGIPVALKQFNNLDPSKMKLMKNEFSTMTKLHHPNIIQLLGYFDSPYTIVMEYIRRGSLSEFLKQHPWTTIHTKISFIMDIAKGLAYLHARKPSFIIHRDIKPSNFLVTQDYHIKIADFGICKMLSNDWAERSDDNLPALQGIDATAKVGTLFYMAPELVLARQSVIHYDSSVDMYSLGAVMYEIMEKEKLYSSHVDSVEDLIILHERRIRPSFFYTPRFLQNIILLCLNHDSRQRPTAILLLKYLRRERGRRWWIRYRIF